MRDVSIHREFDLYKFLINESKIFCKADGDKFKLTDALWTNFAPVSVAKSVQTPAQEKVKISNFFVTVQISLLHLND